MLYFWSNGGSFEEMIISFSVANYFSIKEEVTINFQAASIREHEAECVSVRNGKRLLKSAVIYGANGSGKTNLIKAFSAFRQIMNASPTGPESNKPYSVEPFRLSVENENEPSFFECVSEFNGVIYRYGFCIKNTIITAEWLFRRGATGRESELFSREGIEIRLKNFKEGSGLQGKTREDALFLRVSAEFNGKIAREVLEKSLRILPLESGLQDHLWGLTAWFSSENEGFLGEVEKLLQSAGVGDIRLLCEKTTDPLVGRRMLPGLSESQKEVSSIFKENYRISTAHKKFNGPSCAESEELFDLFENESLGTQKLFGLGGQALIAIKMGICLVVDEFDSHLHPLLTKQLVRLFNSEKNTSGAQLIIATHDTNLLEYGNFRRDQIWFAEKRHNGATDLYSLVEYRTDQEKKIRNDASFEKDYIQGRYGGIPYLGNFEHIFAYEPKQVL